MSFDLWEENNRHSISATNTTNNNTINDVIGSKLDDESGNSLYSKAYTVERHMHSEQYMYPTLANGVTVTSSAAIWTLGAYAVVIPANTITNPFDIHAIHVGTFSANDIYEIQLFSGSDGAEKHIGTSRLARTNATNPGSILPMTTPLINANTQIKAALASMGGANESIRIAIIYHTY
jgi:hypothetical protein